MWRFRRKGSCPIRTERNFCGKPADFIVLDARDWFEALSTNAAVLLSVRGGRVLAQTDPGKTEVFSLT